jgi:IclR family pca regulon transcriptional regulator
VRGIADLADELGLSRSSAHRYVATLTELGYLEQREDRRYRLGLGVIDLGLGSLGSTGLGELARPHLAALRERTALTVSLAVLDGQDIVYLERLRGRPGRRSALELAIDPGSRLPAHCTALGKVLLAHLSAARLGGHAPNTITTSGALREELGRVRARGLAVDDQELAPGLLAIAAPVHDDSNEVLGAIDITAEVTTTSAARLLGTLGGSLIQAAAEISKSLGHRLE